MSTLAWPVGSDARAFVSNSQIASASNANAAAVAGAIQAINFDLLVKAAVQSFQKETGWKPFLGAQAIRVFDPPGPERGPVAQYGGMQIKGGGNKLFLSGGLLSVNTLTVGVTPDSTGTLLTKGRDFWLRPSSAINDEEPFRHIEFARAQYGEPESIVIDGVWGYSLTIPADVWQAILAKAAADAAPTLALAIAQGLAAKKAGDEEERYASGRDTGPLSGEARVWQEYYDAVVADKTRVSL